jgi:hypothetical protein
MFSSISRIRAHRDPRPYLDAKTDERHPLSSLGKPGLLLVFQPRDDYMPRKDVQVNEFLDAARDTYDPSDNWGWSNFWLDVLLEAKVRLGLAVGDSHGSASDYQVDEFVQLAESQGPEMAASQIHHAELVLRRLAAVTQLAGKDYPL